jgi:mono/diheme cytochrome c family protein
MKISSIFLSAIIFCLVSCDGVDTQLLQTVSNGRALYEAHCANCHQSDGSGLAQLIPPLQRADFIMKYNQQLPCIMKYGMNSPVTVNNTVYNLKMPANETLTDKDVYYITQFVLFQFSETKLVTSEDEVKAQLKSCVKHQH